MEATWERGEPIHELTLEEIGKLLTHASLEPKFATRIDEGKANTNYLLGVEGGGKYVLRLHTRDPKAAKLESTVTALLADEMPIAKVVFHSPEPSFSLLEWKPGSTMERLLSSGGGEEVASAAFDLGLALAKMSRYVFSTSGFLSPSPVQNSSTNPLYVHEPWPSTVEGLMGYMEWLTGQQRVIERAGADLANAVCSLSESMRPRLEETVGLPCLVHGDFKASNLLIHEGRLSAVLDWEFAHSGTYLMSIGQLFRHEASLPDEFEARFAAGFESLGQVLPHDWRRLASVVDLLSMMDFLNRPEAGPTMIADVLNLTVATVENRSQG